MPLKLISCPKCAACPIRHSAICAQCDPAELATLERLKYYKSFKAGSLIQWRNEPLDYVASVVDGVASLGKTLEDGRTQMVGLLLPSDFIGHPGRTEIDFDVFAVTDVTLCCFERKPFENLLETTPHIAQRLARMALDELDAARDWMVLLGRKTAREKLATLIALLVRRSQQGQPVDPVTTVELPLTREQIANFLGLTVETVSRQLTAIKKEGVVTFSDRHHFQVTDAAALHAATGDDRDPVPGSEPQSRAAGK